MGWIDKVNALFDGFVTLIDNAAIKDKKDFLIKIYKRSIPNNFSKEDCPAIAVVKSDVGGRSVETDQPDLEKPCELRIIVGISDFSMVDLDEADILTDDLVNKILDALNVDPTLNGLAKGIKFEGINFDFDRREGIWFSEPTLNFTLEGSTF